MEMDEMDERGRTMKRPRSMVSMMTFPDGKYGYTDQAPRCSPPRITVRRMRALESFIIGQKYTKI